MKNLPCSTHLGTDRKE